MQEANHEFHRDVRYVIIMSYVDSLKIGDKEVVRSIYEGLCHDTHEENIVNSVMDVITEKASLDERKSSILRSLITKNLIKTSTVYECTARQLKKVWINTLLERKAELNVSPAAKLVEAKTIKTASQIKICYDINLMVHSLHFNEILNEIFEIRSILGKRKAQDSHEEDNNGESAEKVALVLHQQEIL